MDAVQLCNHGAQGAALTHRAPRVHAAWSALSSWLGKVTIAALQGLCGRSECHCRFCEIPR